MRHYLDQAPCQILLKQKCGYSLSQICLKRCWIKECGSMRENPTVVFFLCSTLVSSLCLHAPQSITCNVHPCHIREFTGWWRYGSTHGYLWLFEREPKGESGLSLPIKKKQSGVVLSEAWVLVADKLTCCGARRSFLSALLIHKLTQTHPHTRCSPLSPGNESPLSNRTIALPFPSLYLLVVIYLGDEIGAAPTANML